jgi:3-methyladenine DNA glycosylase/8-oxoguanine DNA glycosylase
VSVGGTEESASARLAVGPLDLRRSLLLHCCGAGDPTARLEDLCFEKTYLGRAGVVRLRLARTAEGLAIEAHGPGAVEAVAFWTARLPPRDGQEGFAPADPLLRRLHRAHPGLRLVAVPWLWDIAASIVLQQRVAFVDAARSWRRIVEASRAPGEAASTFPSPARIARVPLWQLRELGVDEQRGRALVALAREEVFHPFLAADGELAALRRRLGAIPGIGPWTIEMILGHGAGDPDAVPVGDLHLPHLVCWALAGEPRGSDARMLELLEPYRGQRFRAVRLIYCARLSPPREPRRMPR